MPRFRRIGSAGQPRRKAVSTGCDFRPAGCVPWRPGAAPADRHAALCQGLGRALIEFDITAPEDSPEIYEFEVFWRCRQHSTSTWWPPRHQRQAPGRGFNYARSSSSDYIFTHSSETRLLNLNAPQMFDDQGQRHFPDCDRRLDRMGRAAGNGGGKVPARRHVAARRRDARVVADHLQRFAERAWRRPVEPEELEGYLAAYRIPNARRASPWPRPTGSR
jgi:hypothetical protein